MHYQKYVDLWVDRSALVEVDNAPGDLDAALDVHGVGFVENVQVVFVGDPVESAPGVSEKALVVDAVAPVDDFGSVVEGVAL